MRSKSPELFHSAQFKVALATTDRHSSTLLNGSGKGRRITKLTGQKLSAFAALLAMLCVLFANYIITAPQAKAWDPVGDTISGLCAAIPQGYSSEEKTIFVPGTGDGRNKNSTPYEKYGMAGTTFTSWPGFSAEKDKNRDNIKDNDKFGKKESRPIIVTAGGAADKSGLMQFADAKWTNEAVRASPGLFNTNESCGSFDFGKLAPTSIGNMLLDGAKMATWIAGYAYQTSADLSTSIYASMEKPVGAIVDKMKTALYLEYLFPMLMIAAIWMAWVGLVKRRSTEVFTSIIWLVAAIATSMVLMTKPMLLPKTMNDVVMGISQAGMSSITNMGTTNDPGLCQVKPLNGNESKSTTAVRSIQCNLWYAFVYSPWTMGQFGASPSSLTVKENTSDNGFLKRLSSNADVAWQSPDEGKYPSIQVLTQDGGGKLSLSKTKLGGGDSPEAPNSQQNWALFFLDHKVNWAKADDNEKHNQVRNQYNVAFNQLSGPNFNKVYHGDEGMSRMSMGLMALLSALGAALMIIVVSVSLIIMDLGIIMLAIASPIFFLAALHPGAGRKLALGWVGSLVKLGLKRIAVSIFLAIMIAIFSIMISITQMPSNQAFSSANNDQDNGGATWIVGMILILAISVAGLMYHRTIGQMFNNFNLGQETQGKSVRGALNDAATPMRKLNNMKNQVQHSKGVQALTRSGSTGTGTNAAGANGATGGAGEAPKERLRNTDQAQALNTVLAREQARTQDGAKDTVGSGAGEIPRGRDDMGNSEQARGLLPHGQQANAPLQSEVRGELPYGQPSGEIDPNFNADHGELSGAGRNPREYRDRLRDMEIARAENSHAGKAGAMAGAVAAGAAVAGGIKGGHNNIALAREQARLNKQARANGSGEIVTREVAQASLEKKRVAAKERNQARSNAAVEAAKRTGRNTAQAVANTRVGQATANTGRAIGTAGRAVGTNLNTNARRASEAVSDRSRAFGRMVKAMDQEYTGGIGAMTASSAGRAGAAVGRAAGSSINQVQTKVSDKNDRRRELNAKAQVIRREVQMETKNIQTNRKLDERRSKAELKERRKIERVVTRRFR